MPSPSPSQQPQEGTDQETDLQESRAGVTRRCRLHRPLLQSDPTSQSPRRRQPRAIRGSTETTLTESPLNPGNSTRRSPRSMSGSGSGSRGPSRFAHRMRRLSSCCPACTLACAASGRSSPASISNACACGTRGSPASCSAGPRRRSPNCASLCSVPCSCSGRRTSSAFRFWTRQRTRSYRWQSLLSWSAVRGPVVEPHRPRY